MDGTQEALEGARDALARGENLIAHDLADRARQATAGGDLRLEHVRLLALARSGGWARARDLYERDALRRRALEPGVAPEVVEDVLALGARLEKDHALAQGDGRAASRAADAYEAVLEHAASAYAAVNAATMACLAGEERATDLAQRALALVPSDADDLWSCATRAEAAVVLGQLDLAAEQLARVREHGHFQPGHLASTRRQLRLLVEHCGLDVGLLAPIAAPRVLHYSGHMSPLTSDGQDADVEESIRVAARRLVEAGVAEAHGSLACGTDLLVVGELLAAGVPVHAVLPFEPELFLETSVLPGGRHWGEAFEQALADSTSVTVALEQVDPDPSMYAHAAQLAMGRALTSAHQLDAVPVQLVAWDGNPPGGPAGTAADHATWLATGNEAVVVPTPSDRAPRPQPDTVVHPLHREVRAMLFADVKGFSRLTDGQIAVVLREVLGRFADVVDRAEGVMDRNTWGDGIFVTFAEVAAAADCALAMLDEMDAVEPDRLGLPGDIGLRVGLHAGPVLAEFDRLRGAVTHLGTEVNRAARIEPIAPVGQAYGSDTFAALLALHAPDRFRSTYVGTVPLAKGFGSFPMHVVERR